MTAKQLVSINILLMFHLHDRLFNKLKIYHQKIKYYVCQKQTIISRFVLPKRRKFDPCSNPIETNATEQKDQFLPPNLQQETLQPTKYFTKRFFFVASFFSPPHHSIELPVPPSRIVLFQNGYQIVFLETQLQIGLSIVIVQRATNSKTLFLRHSRNWGTRNRRLKKKEKKRKTKAQNEKSTYLILSSKLRRGNIRI